MKRMILSTMIICIMVMTILMVVLAVCGEEDCGDIVLMITSKMINLTNDLAIVMEVNSISNIRTNTVVGRNLAPPTTQVNHKGIIGMQELLQKSTKPCAVQ